MSLSGRYYRAIGVSRQRGVALLVTLVILTVVTILGLAAMRSGLLHLAIGTNSQVNTLNFQAADAGFTSVEKKVQADPLAAIKPSGILGMAAGFERIACLKKTGFDVPTTPTGLKRCDPTATDADDAPTDTMSGRDAVIVQVAIINPSDSPLNVLGSDEEIASSAAMLVRTISTSVLPAFGSASAEEIKTCLEKTSDDTTNPSVVTVTDCLEGKGASFTTLVQEYIYGVSL